MEIIHTKFCVRPNFISEIRYNIPSTEQFHLAEIIAYIRNIAHLSHIIINPMNEI